MTFNNQKTKFRILQIFVLVFIMIFSLSSCGDDESPGIENTTGSQNTDTSNMLTSSTVSGFETDTSSESVSNIGDSHTSKTDTSQGSNSHTTKKTSGTTKSTSGKTTSKNTTVKTTAKTTAKATTPTTTKSNTYYPPRVPSNTAPGNLVFTTSDGSGIVDYSNSSSGYIMVKYAGAYSNLRVIVSAPNGVKPQYPIYPGADFVALPLTGGSGTYTVSIYGNNGGNSYYTVGSTSIGVSLSSSSVAFSRPNIFCNYTSSTSCVTYAANNLTRGCDKDLDKVSAIYNYVVKNFKYDYDKASSVAATAYVPNLNSVWSSKKGICFDYASTMAAMLRSQGIPTKVEAGEGNGNTYHAWISTYINGSGWVNDVIYFDGTSWKLMDPTFASTGGIGYDWSQKASYSVKYLY